MLVGVNGYTWERGIFPLQLLALLWPKAGAQQHGLSGQVPALASEDQQQCWQGCSHPALPVC